MTVPAARSGSRSSSYLLVRPASEEDAAAAWSSGADALVLDLGGWENAAERAREREAARRFLEAARARGERPALYVRVSPLDAEAIDADLEALTPFAPEGVFLSRARGGESVQHLSAKLAVWEAEFGLEDGSTRIVAMATQTPEAIFLLGTYAGSSARLAALAFDTQDLRRAMGLEETLDDVAAPLVTARALALLGAAAANVPAIDARFADFGDEAELRRHCLAARREGFSARLASHASQIPVINETFAPRTATL